MKNLVAIITRTKNRELLLKRAINSIVNQTYKNWCLVIVNDGGNIENIINIVEQYSDELKDKIKIINNEVSTGMEHASNLGIINSESRYLVIHDDDDSWEPSFLKECIDNLDNSKPNVAGVVTYSNFINEDIQDDKINEINRNIFKKFEAITIQSLLIENMYPPISFVYKRSILNKVGLYNEELPVLGDWDFNIKVITLFRINVIKKVLANWHIRPHSKDINYSNSVVKGSELHTSWREFYLDRIFRDSIRRNNNKFFDYLYISNLFLNMNREIQSLSKKISSLESQIINQNKKLV